MYIGQAAQLSGTTVKSIRHYEAIGLLPEAPRQGRYRLY
ncbi:MerR family transcriptional regulator, partial [Pseudomonas sp. MWU13-2625]